jgi:hypothetical protein
MAKRNPLGVYVRQTPDWFLKLCAIGGVAYISTVGKMSAIELYNDANQGTNLHVYRLWVGNDAGFIYTVTRQAGSLGGTQVPTNPVITGAPALPGIINYADVPNSPSNPPTPYAVPGYIVGCNDAGSLDIWEAGGPICVLTPGTSLRVTYANQSPTSFTVLTVSFFYAALADTG